MNNFPHHELAGQTSAGKAPLLPERERRKPARALVGWMSKKAAAETLAGRHHSPNDPDILKRVRDAHNAVADRIGTFDSTGAVYDVPEILRDYVDALSAMPMYDLYRRHGWQVKMVDLRKVCAVQEIVHLEHAVNRFDALRADDLLSIAKVCLPQKGDVGDVKVHWSEADQHWILSSENPNLNVCAHYNEPQDLGGGRMVPAYGFCAEAQPSLVQVVHYRGRYILRDGYHRSLALAARGIHHIPVVFREYGEFESLGLNSGCLAEPTFLGNNPATIFDFLDDEVSAPTTLSVKKTLIVIEAKRYVLSI
ncbi:hypothetical protein [Pseudoduganella violaceinigra]|uniref:hypothetical protein n=1 Tax=Pseudoduganella violaceinigra TaxID=246602 RepID=UPI0004828B03|nr:hypothetical protein [Pseudoduganella violaceinigra]